MITGVALLLILISLPAFAKPVPANRYQCIGNGVVIMYTTTSISGEPRMTIKLEDSIISRSGEEIHTQDTVLGSLVTIVRRAKPERFIDTLTLIAPNVNVTDRVPRVQFTTRLFSTRTRTTIDGLELVRGLIQDSTAQRLVCTATAVVF